MESKLYKLEVKFSEVKLKRESNKDSLVLFISNNNISNCIKYQGTVSLSIPNFSPESILELRLEDNGIVQGEGSTTISKLCDKTLTGDYAKWIKLVPSSVGSPAMKIKITGSLRNPRRTSPSKPRPGYLSSEKKAGQQKVKCLYVRKLNCAEEKEREIQGVIQRVKARMELNYGELIEDGIKSPVHAGRSSGRSPLRKKTCEQFSEIYDLDLPSRFDISMEKLSTNEPHLLRYVCIALSERIKVMRAQSDEYASIFGVIATFEDPIKDLANSLQETKEQLMREDRKMLELELRIEREIQEIEEECKVAEEKIGSTQKEVELVENLHKEVRMNNEAMEFDGDIEDLKREVAKLTDELIKSDGERETLLNNKEKILQGYDDDTLDIERSKALDEKFQYISQLQSKSSIYDHLMIENLQLNGEAALLSAQLLQEEDSKERISEIELHKETFSLASESLKGDLEKLSTLRENGIADGTKLSKKLEIDVKDLESKCEELIVDLQNKENESVRQNDFFSKLNHANEETRQWIKQDEEEFQEKHANFLEKYEADKNAKDLLVKELGFFADLTLLHVSSSITEERIHNKLEEILEEKDTQKHSMQRMLTGGSKKGASSPRKENNPK